MCVCVCVYVHTHTHIARGVFGFEPCHKTLQEEGLGGSRGGTLGKEKPF